MDILDLLASDNYIPYNRTLAKELGIETAILFGALCGYQRHYKAKEFFREQSNIIEDTCLTEYAIRQSTKVLQEKGLIIVKKKGLPAKNFYQINTTRLLELLSTSGYENDTTGDCENDTTSDNENISTNNKIDNKTNNKIKEYNVALNDDIVEIIDYLNTRAGTKYTYKGREQVKCITARLKEKFTLDDFKIVIDKKVAEWQGTDMAKYIRPETLFGNKFESYLNQQGFKSQNQKSIYERLEEIDF